MSSFRQSIVHTNSRSNRIGMFGHYCVGFAGNTGSGKSGGGGSYINCGNPPLYANLSGARTLCAWVLPWQPANGNNGRIVSKADGSNKRGWTLEFESSLNGEAEYQVTADCVNTVGTPTTMPIAANQWIHLAAVYDPTVPSLTIYTNGYMNNTVTGVPTPQCTNVANNVYIGNRVGGGTAMIGLIDDVRIYNNALTQSDI